MSILPHWLGGKKKGSSRGATSPDREAEGAPTADALLELAHRAEADGDAAAAFEHVKEAIRVDPTRPFEPPNGSPERTALYARAALEAGIALVDASRWEGAESALRLATRLRPNWAPPYVNLAYLEMRRANPAAAIALNRTAINLDRDAAVPRSNLLFTLNMTEDVSAEQNFREHEAFGKWLAGSTPRVFRVYANSRDPERVLRVGYVSGDYRIHPVAQFLEPLLGDHDPSQVAFVCYSNTMRRDEQTREFERRFPQSWRDVAALTDDELADLVIEDKIDILVDLAGHTGDNRLRVFARKPAPIQVAWLGYLNTTGLKTMDYRIVDRYTDPPGATERRSVERLVRMPDSQWAYWPVYEMPLLPRKRVNEPGRVVFGSQNQYAKISDGCVERWAQILSRLPEARLRVAGMPPGIGSKELVARFERFGIGLDRVEAVPRTPIRQYLEAFDQLDIALDSMPYNGATTALDTLWMGVPIVALAGERSISRGTYSVLKTMGRDDLIAESPEEYVELNVRLATDVEWRSELHRTLREQLRRSPLMDISRFAENLEAAYRTMWRDWCKRKSRRVSR